MKQAPEMSTDSKEHLSELMDGEIGGETGRFILRRLEASSELRGAWARYHLIRDCMRYQDRSFAHTELSVRVRQAISSAPDPAEAGVASSGRRWLRPVAGLAVAATVALMAVVAVSPNLQHTAVPAGDQAAAIPAAPFTSPNILARGPASTSYSQVSVLGDAAARKMNSYLLRHYQVAGSSGGKGFVSFVPIVVSGSATTQQAEADDADPNRGEQQPETEKQ
jgi:sigma-E factor negative regulatory protein RseA